MNAKPMVPHREMITEAFRGLGGLGAIGASEAIEAIKLRRDGNPHLQRFNGDPQRINWAYCMVGGGFRSPLEWTCSISPCFSYGRGDTYSASLSEQEFYIQTRPRINCGLVSKTHFNGLEIASLPTVKCARINFYPLEVQR